MTRLRYNKIPILDEKYNYQLSCPLMLPTGDLVLILLSSIHLEYSIRRHCVHVELAKGKSDTFINLKKTIKEKLKLIGVKFEPDTRKRKNK